MPEDALFWATLALVLVTLGLALATLLLWWEARQQRVEAAVVASVSPWDGLRDRAVDLEYLRMAHAQVYEGGQLIAGWLVPRHDGYGRQQHCRVHAGPGGAGIMTVASRPHREWCGAVSDQPRERGNPCDCGKAEIDELLQERDAAVQLGVRALREALALVLEGDIEARVATRLANMGIQRGEYRTTVAVRR